MEKIISYKNTPGTRKYFINLNQILIILSALFLLNCSQIDTTTKNEFADSIYLTTNNGIPYGNFSLTIDGNPVQSYPASKYYSNTVWLNDGTYTIKNIVDYYQGSRANYNYYISKPGAENLQKASVELALINYLLNSLNNDFYSYSSNTILTISVHDSLFDLYILSDSLTLENKGARIELTLKDVQISDINNELTLDSTTPNRIFKYFSTGGYVYSSSAPNSNVKLTLGNIGELNDETTVTINNSTMYKDGGGIESISLSSGVINGFRKEVAQ